MQVSSHRATSSPNQNQPPRGLQLCEPCSQSRPPPKTRLTRSRGTPPGTLKEHEDVVPPRPKETVPVVHDEPASTGASPDTTLPVSPARSGGTPSVPEVTSTERSPPEGRSSPGPSLLGERSPSAA